MNANRLAFFLMLIFIFLGLGTNLKGENFDFNSFNDNYANETDSNKVYFEFNQIIFTTYGMFINLEHSILSIDQVNYDKNGYYTHNITFKTCYNSHPQVCLDCHGCGNKKCIYHCNCAGGPRQD
jgi:hypothetical protein